MPNSLDSSFDSVTCLEEPVHTLLSVTAPCFTAEEAKPGRTLRRFSTSVCAYSHSAVSNLFMSTRIFLTSSYEATYAALVQTQQEKVFTVHVAAISHSVLGGKGG
jgi:hypothetical protein